MITYIFFDPKTGTITHVHRQYRPAEEERGQVKPSSREKLLEEIGAFLPTEVDFDFLVIPEKIKPVSGYRYFVDLATRSLMLVERPRPGKEEQECKPIR